MVKFANNVLVKVFIKNEYFNEYEETKKTLISLFPFEIKNLNEEVAEGLQNNKIIILSVLITNDKQINLLLKHILSKLKKDQIDLLKSQIESRLDSENYFYIRFNKNKLISGECDITECGNCFHVKISIAAFPKTREQGIIKVKEMLDF